MKYICHRCGLTVDDGDGLHSCPVCDRRLVIVRRDNPELIPISRGKASVRGL